jgi:hypothetical protein
LGTSEQQMRLWHRRFEELDYNGFFGSVVARRVRPHVPVETAEELFTLHQQIYFYFKFRPLSREASV